MDWRNKPLFVATLLIGLLTGVVYWQVPGFDYVKYDDATYTGHPLVHAGLSAKGIAWAFTGMLSSNWHPITTISHMLDASLFGPGPKGPHAVNLLLHTANSILLLFLLARMTRAVWPSAFVAALFALHPLHVESVAWVAERKDVLSTFFMMLTLWAYLRYVERPDTGRYTAVVVLYALGLMSKPMLVSLPILLLLLDYWPLRRSDQSSVTSDQSRKRTPGTKHRALSHLILEKWPLFAMAMASCMVTYVVQHKGGAGVSLTQVPLALRLENALISYGMYAWKMVWPSGLCVFYPYPTSPPSLWKPLLALAFVVAVSLTAVHLRARRPYLLVGWVWYLVSLMPVIGVVQVGQQAMADRYTYIPLIGLFIAIAWAFSESTSRSKSKSVVPYVGVMAAVVLASAVLTHRQVGYWKDRYTLFSRALEVTTGNFVAHDMVGSELSEQGKYAEAIEHFTKAMRIKADDDLAHNGLANAYANQGRLEDAVRAYERAVAIRPGFPISRFNLGLVLIPLGRVEKSIEQWSAVVKINKGPQGHPEMFTTNAEANDAKIRQVEAVLRTRQDDPVAHCHYAMVLGQRGRLEEAIRELESVLAMGLRPEELRARIRPVTRGQSGQAPKSPDAAKPPDESVAHFYLGNTLQQERKYPESIREYREAIRLKPDFGRAHNNLAVVLFLTGEYAEAWKEVRIAENQGAQAHPKFLEALTQKMPEPAH